MNTGQMLLVVGAIALLTTLTWSALHTQFTSSRVIDETRIGTLATAMCRDQLDALLAMPFDALSPGSSTDTLTTPITPLTCQTQIGYIYATKPDSMVADSTALKGIRVGMSSPHLPGQVTLYGVVGTY